jgi:hypothetical protein
VLAHGCWHTATVFLPQRRRGAEVGGLNIELSTFNTERQSGECRRQRTEKWRALPAECGALPPQKHFVPPECAALPPQKGFSPPKCGALPPQEHFSPPQCGTSPPQKRFSPPECGTLPPQKGFVGAKCGSFSTEREGQDVFLSERTDRPRQWWTELIVELDSAEWWRGDFVRRGSWQT